MCPPRPPLPFYLFAQRIHIHVTSTLTHHPLVLPPTQFKYVAAVFALRNPTLRTDRVDRVQDIDLWQRYKGQLALRAKANGGDANERWLFHGTGKTAPQLIWRDGDGGFDARLSQGKYFGANGVYFSESAHYSDSYSHMLCCGKDRHTCNCRSDGSAQMFLASVACGNSKGYGTAKDPALERPPPLPGSSKLYASVNSAPDNPDYGMIVVWNNDQAYPRYLVTYYARPDRTSPGERSSAAQQQLRALRCDARKISAGLPCPPPPLPSWCGNIDAEPRTPSRPSRSSALPPAAAAVIRKPALTSRVAIRVAGHTGAQKIRMGMYYRNDYVTDPTGASVFTKEGNGDMHLFRAGNAKWFIGTTSAMVASQAMGGIASTTASFSPLGLRWNIYIGSWSPSTVTVTQVSAAEWQRVLALTLVRVAGHTGIFSDKMGNYALNTEHSPVNGGNVYTSGPNHLYRGTDGTWYVNEKTDMIAGASRGWISSTTSSISPLDLEWMCVSSGAFQLDSQLKVTETSTALDAVRQRVATISVINVTGHTGTTGRYLLNKKYTPRNDANIYTMANVDRHLFRSTNGRWFVSDTTDMLAGKPLGWLASTTSSISPLDLEWQCSNIAISRIMYTDRRIKVTEVSAAELAAERAAYKVKHQYALTIVAVRMAGYTGLDVYHLVMGTYEKNEEHSPRNDANIYTMANVDRHLFRSTNGRWFVSDTTDMLAGKPLGLIASTTSSITPLSLTWKRGDFAKQGWHIDPLIKVTEMSAAELVSERTVFEVKQQHGLSIVAFRVDAEACGAAIEACSFVMGTYMLLERRFDGKFPNIFMMVGARTRSTVHCMRMDDGRWIFVAANAEGNFGSGIISVTTSPLPFELKWVYEDSTKTTRAAPPIKITELSGREISAFTAEVEAERQRSLSITALCVCGHTEQPNGFLGTYALKKDALLNNDAHIYTMVTNNTTHICRMKDGKWCILRKRDGVIHILEKSVTASISPLDLEWQLHDGPAYCQIQYHLDPQLKVVEVSADDLASARNTYEDALKRAFNVLAIRVTGHVGAQNGKMGMYKLDAEHSPTNDANVYSMVGKSGVHLYRAKAGNWTIGDEPGTKESGVTIASASASISPLERVQFGCEATDLEWKFYNVVAYSLAAFTSAFNLSDAPEFVVDPLLKMDEVSPAELADYMISELAVSGSDANRMAGKYQLSRSIGDKNDGRVYTLSLSFGRSFHVWRTPDGSWAIGEKRTVGTSDCCFRSITPSTAPFGLEWEDMASCEPTDVKVLEWDDMASREVAEVAATARGTFNFGDTAPESFEEDASSTNEFTNYRLRFTDREEDPESEPASAPSVDTLGGGQSHPALPTPTHSAARDDVHELFGGGGGGGLFSGGEGDDFSFSNLATQLAKRFSLGKYGAVKEAIGTGTALPGAPDRTDPGTDDDDEPPRAHLDDDDSLRWHAGGLSDTVVSGDISSAALPVSATRMPSLSGGGGEASGLDSSSEDDDQWLATMHTMSGDSSALLATGYMPDPAVVTSLPLQIDLFAGMLDSSSDSDDTGVIVSPPVPRNIF